jgi:hypothetical protein
MATLLQEFETPIQGKDGQTYSAYLYGRSRPADTWQGFIVFVRQSDGRRFETDVETTQPDAQAILYWATGLTSAYFDGALERAQRPLAIPQAAVAQPLPVVAAGGDALTRLERLTAIERDVVHVFTRTGRVRLLTQDLLDALPYAHSDTIRALEDLEKRERVLARRTEEGSDWLFLTEEGVHAAGLQDRKRFVERTTANPRSAR